MSEKKNNRHTNNVKFQLNVHLNCFHIYLWYEKSHHHFSLPQDDQYEQLQELVQGILYYYEDCHPTEKRNSIGMLLVK